MNNFTIHKMVKHDPAIDSKTHYAFLPDVPLCGKPFRKESGYKSEKMKLQQVMASRADCKICMKYIERAQKR